MNPVFLKRKRKAFGTHKDNFSRKITWHLELHRCLFSLGSTMFPTASSCVLFLMGGNPTRLKAPAASNFWYQIFLVQEIIACVISPSPGYLLE